jgi:hypothetical protein
MHALFQFTQEVLNHTLVVYYVRLLANIIRLLLLGWLVLPCSRAHPSSITWPLQGPMLLTDSAQYIPNAPSKMAGSLAGHLPVRSVFHCLLA